VDFLYSTQDLKYDHISLRRLKNIIERCSDKLYANENIPIEDIEIISVVIEEFVDTFHHGKEEQAYFPETKDKDGFAEDIRKFLIEHELGRRIAIMLRRELNIWKENKRKKKQTKEEGEAREEEQQEGEVGASELDKKLVAENEDAKIKEPTARFLKSYAIFIADHTQKEDKFFDLIQQTNIISEKEDQMLLRHYEICKNKIGGKARIEQILRLIEYLEDRWWMTDK
jgi:hemerythrin-like domain-containing protein